MVLCITSAGGCVTEFRIRCPDFAPRGWLRDRIRCPDPLLPLILPPVGDCVTSSGPVARIWPTGSGCVTEFRIRCLDLAPQNWTPVGGCVTEFRIHCPDHPEYNFGERLVDPFGSHVLHERAASILDPQSGRRGQVTLFGI